MDTFTKNTLTKNLFDTKTMTIETEGLYNVDQMRVPLKGAVDALAALVQIRDPYTGGHQLRVARLACSITREMGFSQDRIEWIRIASTLHDIGKTQVPSQILSKPTSLSEAEFTIIKAHPQVAYDILKYIEFGYPVAEIILQHHERLDGSGYPFGLTGNEIYIEAKVLAVADVIEAMVSYRPYRPAVNTDLILLELISKKGILYDRDTVDACLRLFTEKGSFDFK